VRIKSVRFEIKQVEIIDDPGSEMNMPHIAECHVEIGDAGSLGADIFFVNVCNLQWAEHYFDTYGETPLPTVIIVERIDEKHIEEKVQEMFLDCEYGSFDELVSRVAPLMRWEYA
jgi:hypothetical protein